jgi:hypothetical protein
LPHGSGFNLTSDTGGAWYGGAFDGRHLYLTPAGVTTTQAARCDTQADGGCASPAAWTQFDLRGLNIAAEDAIYVQYFGSALDGRYLYFAPYAATTIAVRFDTSRSFTDPASWARFDLSTFNPGGLLGFQGAVFDGEYVYFVPFTSPYVCGLMRGGRRHRRARRRGDRFIEGRPPDRQRKSAYCVSHVPRIALAIF